MKLRTSLFLLTISAFLFSGCYTQLQYSQRANRITDEPGSSGTYSWNGDEEANPQQPRNNNGQSGATRGDTDYTEGYENGYYDGAEDAIYYKNYDAAEWYARHGFGNYYTNFPHHYGSLWRYNVGFHSPFYSDYYPRSFASISFHWGFGNIGAFYGFPHHWYRYRSWHHWDPYYAYGYSPFFINNYYYGGYGYSKYVGVNKDRENNRTYGRRNFGTNRVRSGDTIEAGTNGVLRNRGTSDVRSKTRSSSTVRTRGRTTVSPPRTTSSGSGNGGVRSTGRTGRTSSGTTSGGTTRRTRDNNMQSSVDRRDANSDNTSRSTYSSDWNVQEILNRSRIENRIRNSRAQEPDINRNRLRTRSYNRIQIDFSNNRSNYGTRSNNHININRSKSSSSSNNGTVRSRSSSSSSRGTSSSTRSRSSSRSSGGSDDGSSSRRSRGN